MKVKTMKEIKRHPAVKSIEKEYEGQNWVWAVDLKDGWEFSVTGSSTTFAKTLKEIAEAVNSEIIKSAPESGKTYCLVGGHDTPSIAAGNTWKESEIKSE